MAAPEIAADPDAMSEVLEAYGEAQERFEAMGGYMVEHKTKSVLTGTGNCATSISADHRLFERGRKEDCEPRTHPGTNT